jgi:hypothetical protein
MEGARSAPSRPFLVRVLCEFLIRCRGPKRSARLERCLACEAVVSRGYRDARRFRYLRFVSRLLRRSDPVPTDRPRKRGSAPRLRRHLQPDPSSVSRSPKHCEIPAARNLSTFSRRNLRSAAPPDPASASRCQGRAYRIIFNRRRGFQRGFRILSVSSRKGLKTPLPPLSLYPMSPNV